MVDVRGVAYEIEVSDNTFRNLPDIGSEVTLLTHLTIRDDAHLLFGFSTVQERRLFRDLIKVNGVGAKLALTILSGMEAEHFVRYIHNGDANKLAKLPGIGKKTAERLIVEMGDRLQDWNLKSVVTDQYASGIGDGGSSQIDEAISALVSLGYKPQEAGRFVGAVATEQMSSAEIIRQALKASGKKR